MSVIRQRCASELKVINIDSVPLSEIKNQTPIHVLNACVVVLDVAAKCLLRAWRRCCRSGVRAQPRLLVRPFIKVPGHRVLEGAG